MKLLFVFICCRFGRWRATSPSTVARLDPVVVVWLGVRTGKRTMEESPQQGNQKITLLSLGKGHIISISQGTFHLFYLFICTLSGSWDGSIVISNLLEVDETKQQRNLPQKFCSRTMSFSPDGKFLASVDGALIIWSTEVRDGKYL